MQEMAVMGDDMLQAVASFKLEAEKQADDAAEVLSAEAGLFDA
jgi:hypothetical protein